MDVGLTAQGECNVLVAEPIYRTDDTGGISLDKVRFSIQFGLVKRVRRLPMPRDLLARCKPDPLMPLYIVEKLTEGHEASRLANNPTMQTDCHHLGLAITPLLIHHVECGFAVIKPVLGEKQENQLEAVNSNLSFLVPSDSRTRGSYRICCH